MNRTSKLFICTAIAFSTLPLIGSAASLSSASVSADDQPTIVLHGNVLILNGAKTYGANVLRPDALKVCIVEAGKLDALDREIKTIKKSPVATPADGKPGNDELARMDRDLKSENAALTARDNALQAEIKALKPHDKAGAAALNKKVLALDSDWTAYQGRLADMNERSAKLNSSVEEREAYSPALNAKIGDFNDRLKSFDRDCSGKDYYGDDYAAAKSALK